MNLYVYKDKNKKAKISIEKKCKEKIKEKYVTEYN